MYKKSQICVTERPDASLVWKKKPPSDSKDLDEFVLPSKNWGDKESVRTWKEGSLTKLEDYYRCLC